MRHRVLSVAVDGAAIASEKGGEKASNYPAALRAWLLVGLLTFAYVLSFVDRYILALLIEPIKADLGLSDEEIGWLIGPAFAVFYATMGIPFGWLADRKRRTWIIAIGITVWSLATAASGLARNFWHMFAARMTVGIGEAALNPSAMSIIADSFPPDRRARPVAFYGMGIAIGSGLAALIGAAVLTWAKSAGQIDWPVVGAIEPWQATFIAVGLPGLLVAVAFFWVPEPKRIAAQQAHAEVTGDSLGDTLSFVKSRPILFLGFVSMMCLVTIVSYGHAFLPPAFERRFGWAPEYFAFWTGIVELIIGPLTFIGAGWLADRYSQGGMKFAPLYLMFGGMAVLLCFASVAMLLPNGWAAFLVLQVSVIGRYAMSAVAVTALLGITPSQIRGQIIALYYLTISLAGLFLGPPTVGFLSSRVFGEENIHLALAVLPLIYGVLPVLLAPLTMRQYRAQVARLGWN